jgi:putative transcriptional regulator
VKADSMTGEELGLEILQGLRDIKAGRFRVAYSPVKNARDKLGMTQVEFAKLLGVSARTLEGWEQGIKKPSGAAMSLIAIATARPDVVREVLAAA